MKLKTQRNIWIFSGVCFLIAVNINISSNQQSVLMLNAFTSILCFFNAYRAHKKYKNMM
ncbi:hypothetical protein [Vallitalea maricola]|uniref:Uncharacterized protein n=1 Tax=Vallitalea maricola TaxID=3074433 RepID=A0ACB5UPH3_9FIRM|nr:hypothetical protein AN2V17_37470 [Vallitalea sp. AN17-2]